ncbi:DUF2264 domain-containing protein [Methylovorus menthalis]|uniref:DUF2264 domain-containing protein n=1 Tax=Methylovorus menthalis TaxID=1002227 RepID=UPI001E41B35D|nr:DUF2264 domain-containing protein [Methylovorus menthalis]MCB4811363.1 DUF2264 domain-containing protein [Methylovorus menthalis]
MNHKAKTNIQARYVVIAIVFTFMISSTYWILSKEFSPSSKELLAPFQQSSPNNTFSDYTHLFEYFLTGFIANKSDGNTRAYYEGSPMEQGAEVASIEGFTRTAPLFAAWIYGQHGTQYTLKNGHSVDLVNLLKTGIVNGTNPEHAEYWGAMHNYQQSIVEAADVALVVWLTREYIWDTLEEKQKNNIATWLRQVNGKKIPASNWHLFVIQVNAVLGSLGQPYDAKVTQNSYQRIKSFYVGDGWFKDGDAQDRSTYDFYNAWAFHYHLQWINKIQPTLDEIFIRESLQAFLSNYQYLIGTHGIPIMGRSACYRLAAPAPLIFGQSIDQQSISSGVAKRSLDATWQYFIQQSALSDGNITQGYCGKDTKILEPYSGPASCLWSLRSLIVAFSQPINSTFWQSQPQLLPIEISDYKKTIPAIGWTVIGNKKSADITIQVAGNSLERTQLSLKDIGFYDRIMEIITQKSRRPKNYEVKYNLKEYSSSEPYCDCIKM